MRKRRACEWTLIHPLSFLNGEYFNSCSEKLQVVKEGRGRNFRRKSRMREWGEEVDEEEKEGEEEEEGVKGM